MNDALELFAQRFAPPTDQTAARAVCIPAQTGAADAFLALALTENRNRVVLAVTAGLPEADRLTDDLRLLSARTRVRLLEFPPRLDGDRTALGLRLKTLAALRAWGLSPYPCIIVAPFPALTTPIPTTPAAPIHVGTDPRSFTGTDPKTVGTDPKNLGTDPRDSVGTGPEKMCDFIEKIAKSGYRRVPQVEQEGDFSVRGGILDVWSPGDEYPLRAEFFGDDLESLRRFNPATQVSIERVDSADLLPVSNSTEADGADHATCSFLSLLPPDSALLALNHNEYNLLGSVPGNGGSVPENGGSVPGNGGSVPSGMTVIYVGDPAPRGVPTYDFQTSPLPGFAELGADEAHHPELFDAARQRLDRHLDAARRRGASILQLDDLSGGFELPPQESSAGLLVVTKADRVFTKKKTHVRANAALVRGPQLNDFADLEPNEYVVHVDHGVGRYIGSSEIILDGRRSEVYTIEYADGAKLHVPAAHAHLLSRYVGVKGEQVRLHRLDGKRWTQDKKDAEKAVADLAVSLLETQARRETVPGFAYDTACEGLDAFEGAFPYEETPDQVAAIAAVKKDLAAQKPMDRLICGDAGYGKTEVAMRAAYIAALNGRQVAVLAPTTVLAEQHFETFTSRFDGTPVRIESVSRFQTTGTHAGTFKRLATGVCDIVIGTHALLTPKICFRDLGLIIVDEEQRFGVRHKEFLKNLRATADVLTLSATPIPRTLYLSMTGARDLSLLRTPPRERVAVDTRIVRDSDDVIRTAIASELLRGGQVFFLHNRVTDIGKVEKRLHALGLQARIVVAHGQMDTRTLAAKMRAFERGDYDVLLSTTIIESGIDIPRANTILVDRADMFGMADLYQLRGRVGRSARQGYAYFLLPEDGLVDAEARERLAALKRHGGLGAGFNLAVRDLELRGAGNLLGAQQSGHIAAVGFGLYCQLLQRAIARLKGEKVREIVDVKLNLDYATPRLPYTYIEEDVQRLSLLKRFAEAQDVRIVKALAAEMRDRFGPLPQEAEEFVRIAELRVVCALAGISNVDTTGARAVFYRAGSREVYRVTDLRGKTAARKTAELIKTVRGFAK